MTPSTDKTPSKPKSMLRYEALIPLLLIVGCGWAYGFFFLDHHLKKAAEYGLTQALDVEVNISSLSTHLTQGRLEVLGIDITDATMPNRNRVSIGKVAFGFNWDALLRGKVVIEEASILQIAQYTPRKKPGKVLPKSTEPSRAAAILKDAAAKAQQAGEAQYNRSPISDVIGLLEGKDSTLLLKNLENKLETPKQLGIIGSRLSDAQTQWDTAGKTLSEATNDLQTRWTALSKPNIQNIQDIQLWVASANALQSRVTHHYTSFTNTQKQFGDTLTSIERAVQGLNGTIAKDANSVTESLALPQIAPDSLSAYVLNTYFQDYMGYVATATDWANTYLPPNLLHKKQKYTLTPIPRKKGVVYTYGTPTSYPLFWLKAATISSKPAPGEKYVGKLEGHLYHLSTDQRISQNPFSLTFQGDFPGLNIYGLYATLVIDRRTSLPKDALSLGIEAYPIDALNLLESDIFSLMLTQAIAKLHVTVQRTGTEGRIHLQQRFDQTRFLVKSPQILVQEISTDALSTLTQVTVEAKAEGPFNNMGLSVQSDLGEALSQGFTRAISGRLQREKERLEQEITKTLDAEKAKIQAQLDAFTERYNAQVATVKSGITSLEKDINQQKAALEKTLNDQKAALEKELNKQKQQAEQLINQKKTEAENTLNTAKKEAEKAAEAEKNKQLNEAKKALPAGLKGFF